MRKSLLLLTSLLCTLALSGCKSKPSQPALTPSPLPPESITKEPTLPPTPTVKTTPTPTPVPEYLLKETLLTTYGKTFPYIGTCINLGQLQSKTYLDFLKLNYNSITLENESKPDAVLGHAPTLLSVSDAREKGLYIPDGYKEESVPELHFSKVDSTLKICSENNLFFRYHTLVWHSQTPSWFFRENYDSKGAYVSPEEMNLRLEYFVRNSFRHIYNGPYADLVYAWDITNEYVHASNSDWEKVYGAMGTSPSFVKLAFMIADDELQTLGYRDRVSLFYNDFNTYIDYGRILELVTFINSDKKICDGIGMQSHLSTDNPSAISYKATMKKFLQAGYEVQITELDAGGKSQFTQGLYYQEIMDAVLDLKDAGGNITGITLWGLSDGNSWRSSETPLLYSAINKPKFAYYKVLETYLQREQKKEN